MNYECNFTLKTLFSVAEIEKNKKCFILTSGNGKILGYGQHENNCINPWHHKCLMEQNCINFVSYLPAEVYNPRRPDSRMANKVVKTKCHPTVNVLFQRVFNSRLMMNSKIYSLI
jgi:hypothetical protein